MAKSMSSTTRNLLRLSGMIFAGVGSFHVARYFTKWEFKVGGFELTPLGSLALGALMLSLSLSCFMDAKK